MNENDILIRCDELEWQPTFPGGWIKSTSGHYADMDLYAMLNLVDSLGIRAGYRKFDVEYTLTNDTGTFKMNGPYLGVSIRF